MTIDWTKPLELIDGTPVRLEAPRPDAGPYANRSGGLPDEDGDYWIEREDGQPFTSGTFSICVDDDGWIGFDGLPDVRNREQPA